MRDKTLHGRDRQVLDAISFSANRQNKAHLSLTRIAQLTGISRRHVPRSIGRLKSAGYIAQSRHKNEVGAHDNSEFEIIFDHDEDAAREGVEPVAVQVAQQMVEIWRDEVKGALPVPIGVPEEARAAACRARHRDTFGCDLEKFRSYVRDEIMVSPFLRGGGEKGWKAGFDWVLKPANIQKIREGSYSGRAPTAKRTGIPELGPGGTGASYIHKLGPGGT